MPSSGDLTDQHLTNTAISVKKITFQNILLHSTPNHSKHTFISVTMAFISKARLLLIPKLVIKQKFTQKNIER